MATIFRSEEMTLSQLYLQPDAAYSTIAELGELGIVQFRDLNPNVNAFQRKFVNEVRRCEEMERKLRFLEGEIKKDELSLTEPHENLDAPKAREMIDLEAIIDKLDHELKEINTNADALMRNFNELTELKYNLAMTQAFFQDAQQIGMNSSENILEQNLDSVDQYSTTVTVGMKLGFLSGVIARDRMNGFERMLWRVCRGNVYLKQAEIPQLIEDPLTGEKIHKTVFVVFFQGEQLKTRVQKICEGFRANIYPCPENSNDRRELAMGVMTRLEDLNVILRQTHDHRQRVLLETSKTIRTWQIKVKKIKAIYHTMNMFNNDVARKCLIAECWTPNSQIQTVQLALRKGSELSGSGSVSSVLNRMITDEQPPTHHKLNKFTQGFQNLVDAYGVATYREINPMPFVLITFPFLFAVMFGDAGHGLVVTSFALWMVLKENSLKNKWRKQEVWTIFFGGRYIILLMGLFSIYTGLIYNDVFSKSINIFGSSWRVKFGDETLNKSDTVILEPTSYNYSRTSEYRQMYSGAPYPFGLDPVWQLAENKITFTNSAKMKFAIIIGIIQMGFGVVLSLWNHFHFRHYHGILVEFLPQIIFLACIFFYLIILIFYKWSMYEGKDATSAPSLLIHLINMMLLSYPTDPPSSTKFYSSQQTLQTALLGFAVICIPWLLIGKPIYKILQKRKQENLSTIPMNDQASNDIEMNTHNNHHEQSGVVLDVNAQKSNTKEFLDDEHLHHQKNKVEVDMSEVWVEQGIHTIEYFLGCISHTASYLRLWALSLAHAQLSEVLWHMVFQIGLSMNGYLGGIASFLVFMPWSTLTVFILLLMEGLSAFLHALRLHWVEFQSKFYKGEGYPFVPFSFKTILEETPFDT
ncbi:unnamed protein product [Rotaria socialis]|uniref:V-type proton ATPase subunit a n=1 Tax=Rotaria socialis TaxID=392032 RepID=A0A818DF81_9BILA|nr:unnamed protein product [Rotaria socialis]CAF3465499.1 unnamed protein product [Rotaria socialis]CAF3580442.1 unnamed protein product [Rotaria socialis]CAF3721872.1 unnamed protein product [Rotaria socialis]CAF3753376.1 unnamed protein product [Rotaria socialis]